MGSRDTYGYSSDQYYRRVRRLTREGLISPSRGRSYQLLLSEKDETLLRRLREIEVDNEALSIPGCIALLRLGQAEEERDSAQSERDAATAELRATRKALVRYRRWTLKRLLAQALGWWRGVSQRDRPTPKE